MSGDAGSQSKKMMIVGNDSFVAAIDEWRRLQPDLPNRSEAIRRLVALGLATGSTENARLEAARRERDALLHPPHTTLQETDNFFAKR